MLPCLLMAKCKKFSCWSLLLFQGVSAARAALGVFFQWQYGGFLGATWNACGFHFTLLNILVMGRSIRKYLILTFGRIFSVTYIKIPVPDQSVLMSHCWDHHPLKKASYVAPKLCLCLELWLQTLVQSFVIKSLEKFSPPENKKVLLLNQKLGNVFERVIWFSVLSFDILLFIKKYCKSLSWYMFFNLRSWICKSRIRHLMSAYSYSTFERLAVQYAPYMHTRSVHILKYMWNVMYIFHNYFAYHIEL